MAKSDLLLRVGLDTKAIGAGFANLNKDLKKFSFRAESVGRDLTTRLTLPILGAGAAAIKTFADFDRLEKGLAALNGSAEGGKASFDRLNKVVLDTRTTLDLKTAALGAQRLQGAGLSAAFAERTIKQLGIAATVSGSEIDDVGGVIRQFTQIIGKGKIEQEDLNTILDRMPAIGAVIKKEFGVSTAEGIRATGLSMETFVARLVGAIEKTENFQNVQGGLAKAFESFFNSVQVGIKPLGEAIAKTLNLEENLEKLGNFVTVAAQAFADLNPNLQKFIVFTAAGAAAAGPLIFALGSAAKLLPLLSSGFAILGGPLSSAIKGISALGSQIVFYSGILKGGGAIGRSLVFADAMEKVKLSMIGTLGPAALVVGGIALLAGGIATAYKNSQFFRDQLARVVEIFKPITSGFSLLISSIFPNFNISLASIGDAFKAVFSFVGGTVSATIEVFLQLANTVSLVAGAITDLGNLDFASAADKISESLLSPTGIVKAAKEVGGAFSSTFSESLAGNPVSLSEFLKPVAPSLFDTGGNGSELEGGGSGGGAALKQSSPGDVIGLFLADLLDKSSGLDPLTKKLGLVERKLQDVGKTAKISLGGAGVFDEYRAGLEIITNKQEAFGNTFDGLQEQITLTKSTIESLISGGLTEEDRAVRLLTESYKELIGKKADQDAAQEISNEKLKTTASLYESLGVNINKAFEGFNNGQKTLAVGISLVANIAESAFDSMASGVKGFGQALGKATRSIVGNFIKQGVAAVVSGALANSAFLGPLAIPIGAAAGAGANALFQGLLSSLGVPALADGGITTGAQLALIGEAGPEAVVPLPTLDALIQRAGGGGGEMSGGNVVFRIEGEDLVGLLARADSSYNRAF